MTVLKEWSRRAGAVLTLVLTLVLALAGCHGPTVRMAATAPGATAGAQDGPRADAAGARLVDVAASAGLNYRWAVTGTHPLNILQTIGDGCAFLDYDGDGNLDILLVGPDHLALFKGDGRGHFADVTRAAGLDTLKGRFLGCAVGDYDNDGRPDVYVSGYRTGLLLHNEGGARFRDVTSAAGIKPQPWGTSCAWADLSGSGRLDLIVGNYAHFGPDTRPQLCEYGSFMSACGPRFYTGEKSAIYHNDGAGRFHALPQSALGGDTAGKTLGVAVADFDGSGWPGVAFANDEVKGDLFQNRKGALRNVGASSGTSYDVDGNVHGGMGADWGDYDNDGRMDLALATFQHEGKCVFRNEGGAQFEDQSTALGVAAKTTAYVAFGVKWLDFNNDGWLDLILANGHVQDNIGDIDKTTTYRQPLQLFRSEGGKRFTDLSASAGESLQEPLAGRGLAVGDFDNDGRVDALVVDSEGAPRLLHNETSPVGHWAGFRLVGTGKSNRDAYGATLTVKAGALSLTRQCQACGSYLSSSDPRVFFGLGTATSITRLSVRWPDQKTQVYTNLPVGRYTTLIEERPLNSGRRI